MSREDWYLDAAGRGNPHTVLDSRHADGRAWTEGNHVRPLVHGATYFAELHRRVEELRAGDLLMFVDWRGDRDELLLDDPDSSIGAVLCRAAERGVDVRGLVWRSHLDRLTFSAQENRRLGRRSTWRAARSPWTCGSGPAARTTRSSSSCGTRTGPPWTSPSSAASTSRTAAATTPTTAATVRPSRWPPCTATGRPGTTSS